MMNPRFILAILGATAISWLIFSGVLSSDASEYTSSPNNNSSVANFKAASLFNSSTPLPSSPATFAGLLVKNNDYDSTSVPLGIDDVSIDVKVVGNIATTIMEMNFHNDTNRILEGQFIFPLGEGQTVTSFALDVEGKMRDGVIVEKAEGRTTYESTIRRKIDPGLLEWTKGNNFRSRVYPIPAKGNKRVRIGFQQELIASSRSSVYFLPMMFKDKLKNLTIHTEVVNQEVKPELYGEAPVNMVFKRWTDSWVAEDQYQNYLADKPIAFEIPMNEKTNKMFTSAINKSDSSYFYLTTTPKQFTAEKMLPNKIGILWDISGSSLTRDIKKELEILDAYIKKIGDVSVQLITFSNDIYENSMFNIRSGDCDELKKHIVLLDYDGGTQLGKLDLTKYTCDEFLLFSDGLSNFGNGDVKLTDTPVITITSSQSADHSLLKYIAQKSNGDFINALTKTKQEAVLSLTTRSYRFISAQYDGQLISSVSPSIPTAFGKDLSMSGILHGPTAEITLNYGFGNQVVYTEKINVNNKSVVPGEIVGRIWAQKNIAELDLQYKKNKTLITSLGMEHSVVTRNTSLIVLDRIEDYIAHKIIPPDPEMKKQYYATVSKTEVDETKTKKEHIEKVVNDFQSIADWWKTDFRSLKKKADPTGMNTDSTSNTVTFSNSSTINGATWNFSSDNATNNGTATTSASGGNPPYTYEWQPSNGNASSPSVSANYTASGSYNVTTTVTDANGCVSGSNTTVIENKMEADIQLHAWDPETPYILELKKADKKDLFRKYMSIKNKYLATPSFYLDVADLFMKEGDHKNALRILSNIAELQLEDHKMLRVLAHRLQQLHEMELAISTFKDVMEIREEEPQSYRDLGLACAENKQYQEAVKYLSQVVNKTWDGRFPMIEAFAAEEINHIISLSNKDLDLSSLDKRLIKAMPLDIRVVINWDANNCDMDLWVTDPNGEKCFFSHKDTELGGKISNDFTGGYGPEEFLLRKAKAGKYKVEVDYYGTSEQSISGPTTVQAELYTNYGKPNEKKQEITLRLGKSKEVVNIGELDFANL